MEQYSKKWYESNTLRMNVVIVIIMVLQFVTGNVVMDPDLQAILVSIMNIAIRFKTTLPIA